MKKIVIPNVKLKYEYFINEQGEVYSKATNSFLRPSKTAKGYLRYGLTTETGRKYFMAHRLVLFTYNPTENMEKLEVNHKDGNKENNCLNNLEWCSGSENVKHSIDTGLKIPAKGEQIGNSVLNEDKVLEIIDLLLNSNLSLQKIGEKFGVSRHTIFDIKRKKSWKHLTENINFK